MSKEYTCDNCRLVFYDRDWIWPTDERKDYCSEECFHAAKAAGVIVECHICNSDVTVPHNCPIEWINLHKKKHGGQS